MTVWPMVTVMLRRRNARPSARPASTAPPGDSSTTTLPATSRERANASNSRALSGLIEPLADTHSRHALPHLSAGPSRTHRNSMPPGCFAGGSSLGGSPRSCPLRWPAPTTRRTSTAARRRQVAKAGRVNGAAGLAARPYKASLPCTQIVPVCRHYVGSVGKGHTSRRILKNQRLWRGSRQPMSEGTHSRISACESSPRTDLQCAGRRARTGSPAPGHPSLPGILADRAADQRSVGAIRVLSAAFRRGGAALAPELVGPENL